MDKSLFALLVTKMNQISSDHKRALDAMGSISESYDELVELMGGFAGSSSDIQVRVTSIEQRLDAAGL